MLPRILPWTLGARVRSYSTSAPGLSGFLSDLMKRIDKINLKAELIGQSQAVNTLKPVKKQQSKSFVPKTTRAPARAKIAVKDHPLSSNMFKLMDEKNFLRSNKQPVKRGDTAQTQPRGPPRGPPRGDRPQGRFAGRPGRPEQAGDRRPRRNDRKPAFNQKFKAQPASIVPKKLQSAALKPTLGGDVFLHGKPAKLGVSASTRVAAVAKECLLKSNYPYKLPKSIIDGLDERYSGNKFILQKDFTTDVDAEFFQDRIRRVVRGEADDLRIAQSATPAEQATRQGLMANGSLSMEHKQTIYDVVAGVKSAQDLLKDAAWNK